MKENKTEKSRDSIILIGARNTDPPSLQTQVLMGDPLYGLYKPTGFSCAEEGGAQGWNKPTGFSWTMGKQILKFLSVHLGK